MAWSMAGAVERPVFVSYLCVCASIVRRRTHTVGQTPHIGCFASFLPSLPPQATDAGAGAGDAADQEDAEVDADDAAGGYVSGEDAAAAAMAKRERRARRTYRQAAKVRRCESVLTAHWLRARTDSTRGG